MINLPIGFHDVSALVAFYKNPPPVICYYYAGGAKIPVFEITSDQVC